MARPQRTRACSGLSLALTTSQARLLENAKLTVHDIAREEHVSAAYIYTSCAFPGLPPTLPRLLSMVGPPQLNAMKLMRLIA
jgi:hypothetical protein